MNKAVLTVLGFRNHDKFHHNMGKMFIHLVSVADSEVSQIFVI